MDFGFSPVINFDGVLGGDLRPSSASKSFDWAISNPSNLYDSMLAEQVAYNKHIEEREDSAVQRWVEDVRKAGLNPWSFSGSGSSTSNLTAPHQSGFDNMLSYLNFDLNKASKNARNILGAVKIGAGLASSIINSFS